MRPVGASSIQAITALKSAEPTPGVTSVWLDADLAVGRNRPIMGIPIPGLSADPDDGFALLAALRDTKLDVVGVSTVGGNTRAGKAQASMQEALRRFGATGLESFQGGDRDHHKARGSAAVQALAAALEKGPLTVVALGPLTNLAALVTERPELASRLQNVFAIAGHGENEPLKLGRVEATDFNVGQDPEALRVLQRAGVTLTVLPFSVTSQVFIDEHDLDVLQASTEAPARWLAESSRQWLSNWKVLFGEKRGFNPFDTLAVAAAAHPEWFKKKTVTATVSDQKGLVLGGKGGSTVTALEFETGVGAAQLKSWLLEKLTQPPAPKQAVAPVRDRFDLGSAGPSPKPDPDPDRKGLANLAARGNLGFETT